MKCSDKNKYLKLFVFVAASGLFSVAAYAAEPNIEGIALNCSNCHAAAASAIPTLAHQTPAQLASKLLDFKYQRAPGTIMSRLVKGYGDETLYELADYLAQDQP